MRSLTSSEVEEPPTANETIEFGIVAPRPRSASNSPRAPRHHRYLRNSPGSEIWFSLATADAMAALLLHTLSTAASTKPHIVIGSGIGGLSCAAMLARYGRPVIVLESHYHARRLSRTVLMSAASN